MRQRFSCRARRPAGQPPTARVKPEVCIPQNGGGFTPTHGRGLPVERLRNGEIWLRSQRGGDTP